MAKVVWCRYGITKVQYFPKVEDALRFVEELNADDAVETVCCYLEDGTPSQWVTDMVEEIISDPDHFLFAWGDPKHTIH